MTVSRKSYSREFKYEAVKLGKEIGSPEAGRKLGVCPSNIRRWATELNPHPLKLQEMSPKEMKLKIKKLEKELSHMRKINDVLKKSVGIFSKDEI